MDYDVDRGRGLRGMITLQDNQQTTNKQLLYLLKYWL